MDALAQVHGKYYLRILKCITCNFEIRSSSSRFCPRGNGTYEETLDNFEYTGTSRSRSNRRNPQSVFRELTRRIEITLETVNKSRSLNFYARVCII